MADPLTPDQVPAVIARLARLEQEDRTRHRNIIESAERCKRIAAQATHPEKANYYQSEAERDELLAREALADAAALALAQQALREWVSREQRQMVYDLLDSADVFGPAPLADFRRLLKLEDTPRCRVTKHRV